MHQFISFNRPYLYIFALVLHVTACNPGEVNKQPSNPEPPTSILNPAIPQELEYIEKDPNGQLEEIMQPSNLTEGQLTAAVVALPSTPIVFNDTYLADIINMLRQEQGVYNNILPQILAHLDLTDVLNIRLTNKEHLQIVHSPLCSAYFADTFKKSIDFRTIPLIDQFVVKPIQYTTKPTLRYYPIFDLINGIKNFTRFSISDITQHLTNLTEAHLNIYDNYNELEIMFALDPEDPGYDSQSKQIASKLLQGPPEILKLKKVKKLSVSGNKLTNTEVIYLQEALEETVSQTFLQELDLSNTEVSVDQIKTLIKVLSSIKTLRKLNLSGNNINDKEKEALIQELKAKTTLQEIKM